LLHISERPSPEPVALFINKEETDETEAELLDEAENVLKSGDMDNLEKDQLKWGPGLLAGLRVAFSVDKSGYSYVCSLKSSLQTDYRSDSDRLDSSGLL
jgi:hypothetical protein